MTEIGADQPGEQLLLNTAYELVADTIKRRRQATLAGKAQQTEDDDHRRYGNQGMRRDPLWQVRGNPVIGVADVEQKVDGGIEPADHDRRGQRHQDSAGDSEGEQPPLRRQIL